MNGGVSDEVKWSSAGQSPHHQSSSSCTSSSAGSFTAGGGGVAAETRVGDFHPPHHPSSSGSSSRGTEEERKRTGAAGGGGNDNTSTSTTSSSIFSPPRHHYWDVHHVDPFSRGRVINYLRRMGVTAAYPFTITSSTEPTAQEVSRGVRTASTPLGKTRLDGNAKNIHSNGEEAEEDGVGRGESAMISTVIYTATLPLPLPSPHGSYLAEGVGETVKDAELLAAMHAERVCDTLGVPLFRLPSMQLKYAENIRRTEQRYAPLPGEPLKPEGTPVPPPLRMVSASTERAMALRRQGSRGAETGDSSWGLEEEWKRGKGECVGGKNRNEENVEDPPGKRGGGWVLEGEANQHNDTDNSTRTDEGKKRTSSLSDELDPLSFSSLFSPLLSEAEIIVEHTTTKATALEARVGGRKGGEVEPRSSNTGRTNGAHGSGGGGGGGGETSSPSAGGTATSTMMTTPLPSPASTSSLSSADSSLHASLSALHGKKRRSEHEGEEDVHGRRGGDISSGGGIKKRESVDASTVPSSPPSPRNEHYNAINDQQQHDHHPIPAGYAAMAKSTSGSREVSSTTCTTSSFDTPPPPSTTTSMPRENEKKDENQKNTLVQQVKEGGEGEEFRSYIFYPWSLSSSPRGYLGTAPPHSMMMNNHNARQNNHNNNYHHSVFDPTEGGRWQMVNVLSSRRSAFPEDAIALPCVLDPGALERMKDFFLQRPALAKLISSSLEKKEEKVVVEGQQDPSDSSNNESGGFLGRVRYTPKHSKLEDALVCTHVVLPGSATRMYVAELALPLSLPLPLSPPPSSSSSSACSSSFGQTEIEVTLKPKGEKEEGNHFSCTSTTSTTTRRKKEEEISQVPLIAMGKASQREVAKQLAAMHAELLLDALGVPLFPGDPARQARHARATAAYGRPLWGAAVGGQAAATASPPPPFLPSSSSSSLPLPLKQQLGCGEEIWIDGGGGKGAPNSTTNHSAAYSRTEGERIVGAQNELNFLCSDAMEVYPPSELLEEAEAILARWQREVARSPYPNCYLITKMGDFYRAATLTPVPRAFGVRGGIAIARTPAQAISLCALHAVDSLCALGIPLWTHPTPPAEGEKDERAGEATGKKNGEPQPKQPQTLEKFMRQRKHRGQGTPEDWIGWWDGHEHYLAASSSPTSNHHNHNMMGGAAGTATALEPAVIYDPATAKMVYDGLRLEYEQRQGRGNTMDTKGGKKDDNIAEHETLGNVGGEGGGGESKEESSIPVSTSPDTTPTTTKLSSPAPDGGGAAAFQETSEKIHSAWLWGWKHLLRVLDNHHHHQQKKKKQQLSPPSAAPTPPSAAAPSSSSSSLSFSHPLRPAYLPAYIMEGNQPRRLPHATDLRDILQISVIRDVDEFGKGCTEEELIHIGNEVKVCVQNYLRHQYALLEAQEAAAAASSAAEEKGGISPSPAISSKKKKKRKGFVNIAGGNQTVATTAGEEGENKKMESENGDGSLLPQAGGKGKQAKEKENSSLTGWDARTPPLFVPSVCITGYGRTGCSVHNIAFLRLLPPFISPPKAVIQKKKNHNNSNNNNTSLYNNSCHISSNTKGMEKKGEKGSMAASSGGEVRRRLVSLRPPVESPSSLSESPTLSSAPTTNTTIHVPPPEEEKTETPPPPSSPFYTSLLPPLSSPSSFFLPPTIASRSTSVGADAAPSGDSPVEVSYIPLAVGFSLKKKDAERACYVHSALLLYDVYGEDVLARYRAGLPRMSVVGSLDALKEKCFKGRKEQSPPPAPAVGATTTSSSSFSPSPENPRLPPPKPLIHAIMKNFIDTGRYMTVQKAKRSPF